MLKVVGSGCVMLISDKYKIERNFSTGGGDNMSQHVTCC